MELQGITFIDVDTEQSVHTLNDWGLYLRGYPVKSPPQPKWLTTNVPGSNGEINYTKALSGRVNFDVRTLHMELMSAAVPEKWDSQYSDVLDFLAGKHVHIIFDSDADYYYDAWTEQADNYNRDKGIPVQAGTALEPRGLALGPVQLRGRHCTRV